MEREQLLEEALEAIALAQENVEQAFIGTEMEGRIRASVIPQLEDLYSVLEGLN